VYGLAPNTTITVAPAQLAPVKNRLSTGRADVQYFVRDNVALGVAYWYEQYKVEDYSMNATLLGPGALPNTLFLGYMYEPYTAHSAWVRLSYLW
jgi:hypothetical protein